MSAIMHLVYSVYYDYTNGMSYEDISAKYKISLKQVDQFVCYFLDEVIPYYEEG